MVLLIHGGPRAASMMTFSPARAADGREGLAGARSPTIAAATTWAGNSRARSATTPAPGRVATSWRRSRRVKAKGFVDETRLGVSGWSYGGYMTSWMLGNYPDVWKVGVAGAAVTDRIDQQNFSDGAGGGRGNNSPWLNAQAMERERAQSPMTYAGKIKAPTLILRQHRRLSRAHHAIVQAVPRASRRRRDVACSSRTRSPGTTRPIPFASVTSRNGGLAGSSAI